MNIDEKTLLSEKELLTKDFNSISEKIKQVEIELGSMRSNLNAIYGALQQTDKLLKMSEIRITYSNEIKDSNEKI